MNAIESPAEQAGRLARLLDWVKEKWLGLRIQYGSITAEELKAHGELGARALAGSIMGMARGGRKAMGWGVAELARGMHYHPDITVALGFAACWSEDWNHRGIAIRALGEGGDDALAAGLLIDALEGLKKSENASLLKREVPDEDELLLQRMARKALNKVADRLTFRDYSLLATSEKKEQRMWALRNINPLSLSEEDAGDLRTLEVMLKTMNDREALGALRRILSTWENDRAAMGRVKAPRTGKPEQSGKAGNRGSEKLKR